MDDKLMLTTNVKDMTPVELARRYKALVGIERGFNPNNRPYTNQSPA